MNLLSYKPPGFDQTDVPASLPSANDAGQANQMVNAIASNYIAIFMGFAVIVAIVLLVWSGIQWITSGGDSEKIAAAKKRIVLIFVGLLIIFAAFFILSFVSQFFGI